MSTASQDWGRKQTRHEATSTSAASPGAAIDPALVVGLAINASRTMRKVPEPVMTALRDHAGSGSGAARATLEWIGRRQRRKATAAIDPTTVNDMGDSA
jgi:hypothetical protein